MFDCLTVEVGPKCSSCTNTEINFMAGSLLLRKTLSMTLPQCGAVFFLSNEVDDSMSTTFQQWEKFVIDTIAQHGRSLAIFALLFHGSYYAFRVSIFYSEKVSFHV